MDEVIHMPDFTCGTYPPMCPRSVFLEKQLKSALEGRTIVAVNWERYYTGAYSWHGDVIEGFDALIGGRIAFADASFILTDDGTLAFIAYSDGGIRHFPKGEPIERPAPVKSKSHAYFATFALDDGSILCVNLYGWGTLLKVFAVDMSLVDESRAGKNGRYPFLPKSPIDATDGEDFTFERFRAFLAANPGANVIECCATAKGAMRIDNPVMNYILLLSKVHPRTKARALNEAEIRAIFDSTKGIVEEYQSGERICAHTDIYGRAIEARNDVVWLTSSMLGAPCPVCGAPIESTPAAGTKMYYCPECQVVRRGGDA